MKKFLQVLNELLVELRKLNQNLEATRTTAEANQKSYRQQATNMTSMLNSFLPNAKEPKS